VAPKRCYLFRVFLAKDRFFYGLFRQTGRCYEDRCPGDWPARSARRFKANSAAVKNVISMDEHLNKGSRSLLVRDRRYAIRHPFAADASAIDLETGTSSEGVTSDLSMGGCFVCTSKPLGAGGRIRLTLIRKEQVVHALCAVRIVKPRVGMGLEFLDVEEKSQPVLERWLESLRRDR